MECCPDLLAKSKGLKESQSSTVSYKQHTVFTSFDQVICKDTAGK